MTDQLSSVRPGPTAPVAGRSGREPGVRLTARGATLLIVAVTLAGQLTAGPFAVPFLGGLCFVAVCLGVAFLVRSADLLSLVVTPPLMFFLATFAAEFVKALGGSLLQGLGIGLFTALSGGAPWMFGGSALVLVIALVRGLAGNVRDLREALRGGEQPEAPKPPEFAPEPEGYYEPRTYGMTREDRESRTG
ncbi:DUF6542 domain-containing protein [Rhizohabitans arisaemae]|uniref:DUF6542 domain-containing protein n=1 Tax=Rhizohabitans arisaemae TaxID=2720610 RepID=UPI0024B06DB7|nr:DUF6542 domain-containing protein [Rhizohabitans arisaemae]